MVKVMIGDIELETERKQKLNSSESEIISNDSWIRVEERIPPQRHTVLYLAMKRNEKKIMIGQLEHGIWTCCYLFTGNCPMSSDVRVTHWMELPGYPNE
jgi:Protein of unknown function (DUF551)